MEVLVLLDGRLIVIDYPTLQSVEVGEYSQGAAQQGRDAQSTAQPPRPHLGMCALPGDLKLNAIRTGKVSTTRILESKGSSHYFVTVATPYQSIHISFPTTIMGGAYKKRS